MLDCAQFWQIDCIHCVKFILCLQVYPEVHPLHLFSRLPAKLLFRMRQTSVLHFAAGSLVKVLLAFIELLKLNQ